MRTSSRCRRAGIAEHARVELKRLNVLIGANGSGKSNFVGVFKLVREIVEDRDQQAGSTFRRPSEAEISGWLDEYGLGDLWETNVIGGRPR